MTLRRSERLVCTAILGRLMGDVMLTADELRGLAADLLISHDPPGVDPAERLAYA